MPVNYTDMVKRLRRLLRPYSVHAIIDACIEVLDKWRGTGLDELKSAPWLTLLIVKLVLEDRSIRATLNKPSKISAQTWMTQFFGLLCLSRGPFGQFAGR